MKLSKKNSEQTNPSLRINKLFMDADEDGKIKEEDEDEFSDE